MIKRLRNRFIRIAMLSVTAVMLLLTVILNVANYVSTDSDLKQTLTLIYENAGTIPHSRFLPPSGSDSADAPTPPENDGSLSDIAPPDAQDVQAPPDDKIARHEGPFTAETPQIKIIVSATIITTPCMKSETLSAKNPPKNV